MGEHTETQIREEIRMLREAMAVVSDVAQRLNEMIKYDPAWVVDFQYPVGQVDYNIDLEDLSKGKVLAVHRKKV